MPCIYIFLSVYSFRLAAVINVVSQAIAFLLQTDPAADFSLRPQKCIPATSMHSAIALTKYCSVQRQIFEAVSLPPRTNSHISLFYINSHNNSSPKAYHCYTIITII